MTFRKATKKEAMRFVKDRIAKAEDLDITQLNLIVEQIFPYSWLMYCNSKKIQTLITKKEKK